MIKKFLYLIKDALKTAETLEKQRRIRLANEFLETGKSFSEGLEYFRQHMDSIPYFPHDKITKEDVYNILDSKDRRIFLHGIRGVSFLNDKEIAMYAMGIDARLLEFFSEDVRNDRNVVYAALSGKDRNVLQFVGDKLYEDREFQLLLLGVLGSMVGGNVHEKVYGSNQFYDTEEKYIAMIDELLTRDDIMGLETVGLTSKKESVIWSYSLRKKNFEDSKLLEKVIDIVIELNPNRKVEAMACCLDGMGLSVNNKVFIDKLWDDGLLDFIEYRDLTYIFKKWDSYLGKTILEKFPKTIIYCDNMKIYPNSVKTYITKMMGELNACVQNNDETILGLRLDEKNSFISKINNWGGGYKKYNEHVQYVESFLDKESVLELARFGFIKMLVNGEVKVGRGIIGEKDKNIYAHFFESEEFLKRCTNIYLEQLERDDILGKALREDLNTPQNGLSKKKLIKYLKKCPEFKRIVHWSQNYYRTFSLKEIELFSLTHNDQERVVYDVGQLGKKDIEQMSLETLVQNVMSEGRGGVVEEIFKVRPIHRELSEDIDKINVLKHAFEKRLDFMFANYLTDFENLWGKENVAKYLVSLRNYRKDFNNYCIFDFESLGHALKQDHNYYTELSHEIMTYVKSVDELKVLVGEKFIHFSRLLGNQEGKEFLNKIDLTKEDVVQMVSNARSLYESKDFLKSSLCDIDVMSLILEKSLIVFSEIPEKYFYDKAFLRKCAEVSPYDGGAVGHLINSVPQKILKNDSSFLELMDSFSINNLRPVHFSGKVEDIEIGLRHMNISRLFLNEKFKQEWEKTYGTEVSIMEIVPTEPMAVKEIIAKIREKEYQNDVDFMKEDVKLNSKVKKF